VDGSSIACQPGRNPQGNRLEKLPAREAPHCERVRRTHRAGGKMCTSARNFRIDVGDVKPERTILGEVFKGERYG